MRELLAEVRRASAEHRMFLPGQTVVVAVSGGPDSVALAHLLLRLAPELSLRLHAAHLDHCLRGEESAADARFVGELMASWRIPLTAGAVDVPAHLARAGGSAEEVARRLRYEFLDRVAAEVGAERIALGHQADDLVETILMNLLQGAGPRGLAGIPPVRGERYVRPLLSLTRAEIIAYLAAQEVPYRLDPSNAAPDFFRNRIRNELIPYLERVYAPNLRALLVRTGNLLREEDEYLEGLAGTLRQDLATPAEQGGWVIPAAALSAAPSALARRVVRQLWTDLAEPEGEAARPSRLSYERVEAVLALAREGRTGKRLELPGGVRVRQRYTELVWQRKGKVGEAGGFPPTELIVPGETFVQGRGLTITAEERSSGPGESARLLAEAAASGGLMAVFDLDRLDPPLELRGRRPGDRFRPLGAPGRKKLKDHLIDRKVPREERDRLILLADRGGERPVWVVGDRPANEVRVTPGTNRLLVLRAGWREL